MSILLAIPLGLGAGFLLILAGLWIFNHTRRR
jgi:hypothetical protein